MSVRLRRDAMACSCPASRVGALERVADPGPALCPGTRNCSRGRFWEAEASSDSAAKGGFGNGGCEWKRCYPAINALQLWRGYIPPNQSSCISKLEAVKMTSLDT